jgi:hypothetical protein
MKRQEERKLEETKQRLMKRQQERIMEEETRRAEKSKVDLHITKKLPSLNSKTIRTITNRKRSRNEKPKPKVADQKYIEQVKILIKEFQEDIVETKRY